MMATMMTMMIISSNITIVGIIVDIVYWWWWMRKQDNNGGGADDNNAGDELYMIRRSDTRWLEWWLWWRWLWWMIQNDTWRWGLINDNTDNNSDGNNDKYDDIGTHQYCRDWGAMYFQASIHWSWNNQGEPNPQESKTAVQNPTHTGMHKPIKPCI